MVFNLCSEPFDCQSVTVSRETSLLTELVEEKNHVVYHRALCRPVAAEDCHEAH